MKKIDLNMDIKDIKLFSRMPSPTTGNIDYTIKKINLLPENYYKRKRRKNIITIIFVGFFCTMSYFSFYLYQVKSITSWYNHQVYSTEATDGFSGLNEQILNFTNEKNSQDLIFELKKRIDKKSSMLQEIEATNKSILYLLTIVEKELPSGIRFQALTVNSEDTISISCEASSNKEVAELIHNLKKTSIFSSVFVASISNVANFDEPILSFTIECKFGGEKDASN